MSTQIEITPAAIEKALDEFWEYDLEDGARPALLAACDALLRSAGITLVVKTDNDVLDESSKLR